MQKLKPEDLRLICGTDLIKSKIKKAGPIEDLIGQERAVKALKFGLGIKADGFNIYVSGEAGTGKLTAVKRYLTSTAKDKNVPVDWCYVNNFQDSYKPQKLKLPTGRGCKLKKDMKNLVDEAQQALIKSFESDEYAEKRKEIINQFERRQNELFNELNQKAKQENLHLSQNEMGIAAIPLSNGEPMSDEEFNQLEPKAQDKLREKQRKFKDEIKNALRTVRKEEKSANEKLSEMESKVAEFAIEQLFEELLEKYDDVSGAVAYLKDVKADIVENFDSFLEPKGNQKKAAIPFQMQQANDIFTRYEVNVLVDNSDTEGAPVELELNPTYNNLFGRVEKESEFGTFTTDFSLIRDGALHRANGGYLVIPVEELFRNMFSWDSLKRALRNGNIEIEEAGERLGFLTTKTLKPEPIPLDIKVVLIGDARIYHMLYQLDDDFRELFKVKADFDNSMERSDENITDYISFIGMVCEKETLCEFDASGLAKLVEHGSRIADDREKLSTRFGELSDVIREASYYAKENGNGKATADDVVKAIEEKKYRSNLIQEKINELIEENTIMIDIEGEKVGQVNGLAVLGLGDINFGKPNRITASISLGKGGVIAIEREAELSGKIHTKGVLILSGYLAEKFNRDKPFGLSARLVFEQSYSEIEGDSASSTELYALLSSLSGVPIRQGIAVTGSVNQKGEVQAIGGVNEKVEGYFEVCKLKGLNGNQGVMIPQANVKNLMVKEEVVKAVKDGKFNIWSVSTIDEGIEVLTGKKAGKLKEDGKYEKDSIYFLVDQELDSMAEKLKKFASTSGSKENK